MEMEHPISADTQPGHRGTGYLWGFGAGCLLPLLAIVMLNALVDPCRTLHGEWWQRPYPTDPRRVVPGVIRTAKFDAVVIGTSHCDNFLPSSMKRELGWQAIRCTLPGSHTPQQCLTLRLALDSGNVRHVLWGLDLFSFYGTPGEPEIGQQDFPFDYYQPTWRHPLNYLLNLRTAEDSIRCLAGRGDPDLEMRGTWHTQFEFSEASVLKKSLKQLEAAWKQQPGFRQAGWSTIVDNVQTQIVPILAEHPDVEFRLILPPICALAYLAEFQEDAAGFAERLRFRELLCSELARFPNVKLYDFEIATDLSQDLSHCMDLTHYDGATNDWILTQIARDAQEYRLTPATLESHQHRFAHETERFVRPILQGEHRWSTALQIDRFRHTLTPSTLARLPRDISTTTR